MKTLEEFVALFAEQFDETDASEFAPETDFRRPRACHLYSPAERGGVAPQASGV